MSWSLRRPEVADAEAIRDLVQDSFETYRSFAPAGWDPPREDLALYAEELAKPTTWGLVALDDGAVVGHVRFVPAQTPSPDGSVPDIHFRSLFVRESHWGTGLALELHGRAVAEMRGVARLFTPAGQVRARRFYEREGWQLHFGPFDDPKFGMPLVEYRR